MYWSVGLSRARRTTARPEGKVLRVDVEAVKMTNAIVPPSF